MRRVVLAVAASVAVVVAAVLWARVASSLGEAPAIAAVPPADAAVTRDAAPDAYVLEGDVIDVAAGVKLVAPLGWEHERVDDRSVLFSRYGLGFLVAVTSGPRHATLHAPRVGIMNYVEEDKLAVESITDVAPNRVLARIVAPSKERSVIYTVEQPHYRVVVLLKVPPQRVGDPDVEVLLSEIMHDRLMLP